MIGKYDDMLCLPHPTSSRHPRMPRADRAAQFSPFSALNGHEAAIEETARLTDCKIELAEDEKRKLDSKIQQLLPLIPLQPELTVVRFIPDLAKDGGGYYTFMGRLKKIDPIDHSLQFTDGTIIAPEDVLALDSPHLKNTFDP